MPDVFSPFLLNHTADTVGGSRIMHTNCIDWLSRIPENSLHAVVTDPPYGVKEYDFEQLEKRSKGVGGIWRLPPAFDGSVRSPLPRFTALNQKERKAIYRFFLEWAKLTNRALRPGGHIFLASNVFLSQLVLSALIDGGLEYRGALVRLVRTMRGGDRPKNAEQEFSQVCSLPRGCYEPWGILRKPLLPKMKVSECLQEFQTGGLRRHSDGLPFRDVIDSARTPKRERDIAPHPSIKPQHFLRQIVYASLPLGEGIVVDPFMGSGSTIAAAEAVGYKAIGVERFEDYYTMAKDSILQLASLYPQECEHQADLLQA